VRRSLGEGNERVLLTRMWIGVDPIHAVCRIVSYRIYIRRPIAAFTNMRFNIRRITLIAVEARVI